MPSHANSATLNVQPRQRRAVYQNLNAVPGGRSAWVSVWVAIGKSPFRAANPRRFHAAAICSKSLP